jgi:hypothetical protein
MKFAMQDPRTQQYLSSSNGGQFELIGFFFHDRGSMIQKTLKGMMQELLFQFLDRFPELFDSISHIYKEMAKTKKVPHWTEAGLQDAIYCIANCAYTENNRSTKNVCLFIDALDEHSGDNEALLQLLNTLSRIGAPPTSQTALALNIKVCVASRPWPIFKSRLESCPHFAMDKHTKVRKIPIESTRSKWLP